MGRYKPEWSLSGGQRRTVHGIGDDHFGFENSRIKFRQGEDHAITILRFGDNISGHRGTSKLFSLRNPSSAEELLKKYTLIRFPLFVVRIHDRERFPRHLFQIRNGEHQRSGNGAADSKFRRRCGGLR